MIQPIRQRIRRRNRGPARDEAADRASVQATLLHLEGLLARIGSARAAEVAALRTRFDDNPQQAWRDIDSNAWWAGAGSLAAETMADNPGLPQSEWDVEIRAFRELLIDIAELLRKRGMVNPGLSSWLLAFRNWNA